MNNISGTSLKKAFQGKKIMLTTNELNNSRIKKTLSYCKVYYEHYNCFSKICCFSSCRDSIYHKTAFKTHVIPFLLN